eukprot:CAMPEP_0203961734 /NCGR_PEP_ID=MMETSP0359-20131031/92096_1 /ASSEMBLY_ACC=CAM_ASM_000338 /TAXON_ID=268821 /ORGANISM="Scrippsiella Hangoei, Strain SHTV-5" /LENGTH=201 /DNA_ID=CAMNT_0050896705 /DNA_START=62 /DNA_END=667 /DNA_ORIENTATION=+
MAELSEPTRPQSSYWIWLSENRADLTKEAGPGSVALVAKLGGQKWKAMSDVAKKPFEAKAAVAKQEYEKKMAEFVAAGGVKGKRKAEKAAKKTGGESKKAKKDARAASGQPKRPPSGYWLYVTEKRESFEKEAGSKKGPVIAKMAGAKWKAMSDAQKKPYEDQAKKARDEYTKAVAEWKASGGGAGGEAEEEDGEEEEEEE